MHNVSTALRNKVIIMFDPINDMTAVSSIML